MAASEGPEKKSRAVKKTATAKKSARKMTETAKTATREAVEAAAQSSREAAGAAKEQARRASDTTAESARQVGEATGRSGRRAAATVKATRAARGGLVDDARRIADEADLQGGKATQAIEEVEARHYDVVVNKRGLSVSALTTTLNERWDNGWALAQVFEQRGNTVLVYEKRD